MAPCRSNLERACLGLRHDIVCGALVTAEGQRGFRVAPISLADLEDMTNTRVMLETEALRLSIRHGGADWEDANRAFHEALIAGHDSPWSRYLLGILYRHAERYRYIAMRVVATEAGPPRDVHREHEDLFRAAIGRQEARAALALEAHVRNTCEVLKKAGLG